MKQGRASVAIAALLATSILIPASALAEPTPAPSPESTRSPFEQFKIDRDAYLEAIRVRSQQIRVINNIFKESCDKSARDFKLAMSQARTPDQKNLANTLRKNAVSAAIVARDAAITALGPEPIAPIEPTKPMKIANKKKQR